MPGRNGEQMGWGSQQNHNAYSGRVAGRLPVANNHVKLHKLPERPDAAAQPSYYESEKQATLFDATEPSRVRVTLERDDGTRQTVEVYGYAFKLKSEHDHEKEYFIAAVETARKYRKKLEKVDTSLASVGEQSWGIVDDDKENRYEVFPLRSYGRPSEFEYYDKDLIQLAVNLHEDDFLDTFEISSWQHRFKPIESNSGYNYRAPRQVQHSMQPLPVTSQLPQTPQGVANPGDRLAHAERYAGELMNAAHILRTAPIPGANTGGYPQYGPPQSYPQFAAPRQPQNQQPQPYPRNAVPRAPRPRPSYDDAPQQLEPAARPDLRPQSSQQQPRRSRPVAPERPAIMEDEPASQNTGGAYSNRNDKRRGGPSSRKNASDNTSVVEHDYRDEEPEEIDDVRTIDTNENQGFMTVARERYREMSPKGRRNIAVAAVAIIAATGIGGYKVFNAKDASATSADKPASITLKPGQEYAWDKGMVCAKGIAKIATQGTVDLRVASHDYQNKQASIGGGMQKLNLEKSSLLLDECATNKSVIISRKNGTETVTIDLSQLKVTPGTLGQIENASATFDTTKLGQQVNTKAKQINTLKNQYKGNAAMLKKINDGTPKALSIEEKGNGATHSFPLSALESYNKTVKSPGFTTEYSQLATAAVLANAQNSDIKTLQNAAITPIKSYVEADAKKHGVKKVNFTTTGTLASLPNEYLSGAKVSVKNPLAPTIQLDGAYHDGMIQAVPSGIKATITKQNVTAAVSKEN